MKKDVKVKCPTCKKEFAYLSSKFRPFCMERCKEIDLGGWLMESFRLPSNEPLRDEDLERILREKEEREEDV